MSCESLDIPKPICACYVFSPEWSTCTYYVEIKDDGTIETTFGYEGDSIRDFMDNGSRKLKVGRNFYISDSVISHMTYDFETSQLIELKGPKTQAYKMSKDDFCKFTEFLKKLPNQSSKDIFSADNFCNWPPENSAGIILLKDTIHYMFWYDSCTYNEKNIYEYICKHSPIPILPDLSNRESLSSEDDAPYRTWKSPIQFKNPEQ